MEIEKDPLLTPAGFNRRFEYHLAKTSTYREAYEATEKDHFAKFNHNRYRNFESFKQARTQWVALRRKREQGGRLAA